MSGTPGISGIYRIVCRTNGRYYYGSSKDIGKRWAQHKNALRKGKHDNPHLQSNWNKYGESAFSCESVELVSVDKLVETESKYVNEHVGKQNCMNIKDINSAEQLQVRQMQMISSSAAYNSLPYNLTSTYVNALYTNSGGSCYYSNQPISVYNNTAKLVSLDKSKGFVEGNVAWVHSTIAPLAKNYSENDLVNLCMNVAERYHNGQLPSSFYSNTKRGTNND